MPYPQRERGEGGMLISLPFRPRVRKRIKPMASPVRRSCGYHPSSRASTFFDWFKITILGDRGKCVCEQLAQVHCAKAERSLSESRVQRPRPTITPPSRIEIAEFVSKNSTWRRLGENRPNEKRRRARGRRAELSSVATTSSMTSSIIGRRSRDRRTCRC